VNKKAYKDRLKDEQRKTGNRDAVVCGKGFIKGRPILLAVMDPTFMMGSMGSVVGEKITRTIEAAAEEKLPLLIVSCSGGARMQESTLSLMQMAKTSAALARLDDAGCLFISLLADPTTGGVTASFAMLGDFIVAEPKALIGFAGPRTIWNTIKVELPEGFQRSEFLEEHGFIDFVVHRKDLRSEIARLTDFDWESLPSGEGKGAGGEGEGGAPEAQTLSFPLTEEVSKEWLQWLAVARSHGKADTPEQALIYALRCAFAFVDSVAPAADGAGGEAPAAEGEES